MSAPDTAGPVRGARRPHRLLPGRLWVAAVCAALFAALVITVLAANGKRPLPGDRALHAWALAHRPDAVVAAARMLTDSGTGVWPYLLAALAGTLAGRSPRGRAVSAVAALAVLLLGQGLRQALMLAVARPRPPHADWATHASGFSMPSGHSTTSALVAGLVCWAAPTAHGECCAGASGAGSAVGGRYRSHTDLPGRSLAQRRHRRLAAGCGLPGCNSCRHRLGARRQA